MGAWQLLQINPLPSTCDGEVAGVAVAATDGGALDGEGPSVTLPLRSTAPPPHRKSMGEDNALR